MKKATNTAIGVFALCLISLLSFHTASALDASHFAASSRLSEGLWVKIEVDTTGVYAIDYSSLRQWGFTHPERVQVYGTGAVEAAEHGFARAADDLPYAPSMHNGDRLIFFAEGDTRVVPTSNNNAVFSRNYYDSHSYYFLSQSETPAPQKTATPYDGNPSDRAVIDRSLAVSVVEPEEYNPGHGGAKFYSNPIAPGLSRDFILDVEDFTERRDGEGIGYLGYSFIANQTTTPKNSSIVSLADGWSVSNETPGQSSQHVSTALFNTKTGNLNFFSESPGRWLKVSYGVPTTYTGDFWCLDYIYAIYTQLNRLGSKPWRILNFTDLNSGTPISVADAPENLRIWNVTDPVHTTEMIPQRMDDGSVVFTLDQITDSSNPGRVLIFDPDGTFPTPTFKGEVLNQNLHANTEIPQMLIVTTRTLAPAARELAQIHADLRNFDAQVVCQDDIFNEFSSGSRNPQGIRRYIKMLYDRDAQGRFGYILLYGPSVSNNRFIGREAADVLVCMQAESDVDVSSNSTNYCADAYFGMVDDDFNIAYIDTIPHRLSVGRLPIINEVQAHGVNAKIARFISNPTPAGAAMRAFFISDLDGNATKDEHTAHNETARAILREHRPDMVFSNLDMIEFSSADNSSGKVKSETARRFNAELETGINILWYSGHGATSNFTSQVAITGSLANQTTNSVMPWAVLSTCNVNGFDYAPSSIVAAMVLNPNGGFIGATGSGRSVYLSYNEMLNRNMATQLAMATPGMTMADVFRGARNALLAQTHGTSQRNPNRNALCYNYCGDPSIPLPLPGNAKVEITGIGGSAVTDEPVDVATMTEAAISAQITGPGSETFNGVGQIRLFAPRVVREREPDPSKKAWLGYLKHTFIDETDMLAEYPVTVENGRISTSAVFPAFIADSARVYIYVRNSDTGEIASGQAYVNLKYQDTEAPEVEAPSFVHAYIDSPSFANGDIIASVRTITAEVKTGAAGAVTAVSTVSSKPGCIIDGNLLMSPTLSASVNDDGNLTLYGVLPQLPDGPHDIYLTVNDFAGNTAEHRLHFTLDSAPLAATLTVSTDSETEDLVRESIEFNAEDISAGAEISRLVIRDHAGNTVLTIDNPSFPYVWNLKKADGTAAPDGVYTAHGTLRRHNSYGSTGQATFTLIAR